MYHGSAPPPWGLRWTGKPTLNSLQIIQTIPIHVPPSIASASLSFAFGLPLFHSFINFSLTLSLVLANQPLSLVASTDYHAPSDHSFLSPPFRILPYRFSRTSTLQDHSDTGRLRIVIPVFCQVSSRSAPRLSPLRFPLIHHSGSHLVAFASSETLARYFSE